MCGCRTSSSKVVVNSTNCGSKTADLHKVRNDLILLEKLTTDPAKLEEYRTVRSQVEVLIKDAVESCPSLQTVSGLKQYVKDEFANYNN